MNDSVSARTVASTDGSGGYGFSLDESLYAGRPDWAAAGRPGFHIYNVGTGVETSVVDLYSGLAQAVGSDLKATHGAAKAGEQQRSVVDAAFGRRELGLPEPLRLQDGLARTAAWFRERDGVMARA